MVDSERDGLRLHPFGSLFIYTAQALTAKKIADLLTAIMANTSDTLHGGRMQVQNREKPGRASPHPTVIARCSDAKLFL